MPTILTSHWIKRKTAGRSRPAVCECCWGSIRRELLRRVNRFLEILFLAEADELLRDLAVLEEDHGRDRADAVLHRHLAVAVGVDLADLDLAGVLGGDLVDRRREHPA